MHLTEYSNFAANLKNKADACDQWAACICFHLSQDAENEANLARGDFGSPVNTDRFWWDVLNYSDLWMFWHCTSNKMEVEQCWVIPQTVVYLEQRNWKQRLLWRNLSTWKIAKWDFIWILTLERRRNTVCTYGWMQEKQTLHCGESPTEF